MEESLQKCNLGTSTELTMDYDKLRESNERILHELLKIGHVLSEAVPMVASQVASDLMEMNDTQRKELVKQQQTNHLELIYAAAHKNEQFEVCATIKAELDARKQ